MSRARQVSSPAASGSQVLQGPEDQSTVQSSGTLRLRGENNAAPSEISNPGRHIRWSNDVVDNEGMGKKRSKGESVSHQKKKKSWYYVRWHFLLTAVYSVLYLS